MIIEISAKLLARIHAHLESAYPEEGAGFLFGEDGYPRRVTEILPVANSFEGPMRERRYLIPVEAYLEAEMAAERLGLGLIGVFHSHPEHPNTPSETDRELAQPFFSYLITSVVGGLPTSDRAWRLKEDRSGFDEEAVAVIPQTD